MTKAELEDQIEMLKEELRDYRAELLDIEENISQTEFELNELIEELKNFYK